MTKSQRDTIKLKSDNKCHRFGKVSSQASSVGGSSGDTRPVTLPIQKTMHCQSLRNFGESHYESILSDSDDTRDSVTGVTPSGHMTVKTKDWNPAPVARRLCRHLAKAGRLE